MYHDATPVTDWFQPLCPSAEELRGLAHGRSTIYNCHAHGTLPNDVGLRKLSSYSFHLVRTVCPLTHSPAGPLSRRICPTIRNHHFDPSDDLQSVIHGCMGTTPSLRLMGNPPQSSTEQNSNCVSFQTRTTVTDVSARPLQPTNPKG